MIINLKLFANKLFKYTRASIRIRKYGMFLTAYSVT